MTRKIFAFTLIFLCFLAVRDGRAEMAPDIASIVGRGRLIVALHKIDLYPLFYIDERGGLRGHDVELARGIARELGVALEFRREASTFDEIVEMVRDGRADMGISLVSITPKRALKVRFSDPYLIVHPVVIMNRLSSESMVDGLVRDESGDRTPVIAEPAGNSYIGIAQSLFPRSIVRIVDDWPAAMRSVIDREADMVVRDEIGLANLMDENENLSLHLSVAVMDGVNDSIGVVLPERGVHLERWVNVFLKRKGYPLNSEELFERYGD